jgi:hypothetical protein
VIASTQLLVATLWHMLAIPLGDLWDLLKWTGQIVVFGAALSVSVSLLIARRSYSREDGEGHETQLRLPVADFSKKDELEGARLQSYRHNKYSPFDCPDEDQQGTNDHTRTTTWSRDAGRQR